VLYLVMWR